MVGTSINEGVENKAKLLIFKCFNVSF